MKKFNNCPDCGWEQIQKTHNNAPGAYCPICGWEKSGSVITHESDNIIKMAREFSSLNDFWNPYISDPENDEFRGMLGPFIWSGKLLQSFKQNGFMELFNRLFKMGEE